MANKKCYVTTVDKVEIPAFYRILESEPTMVVVFDAKKGQQIGNFDKDLFEQTLGPELPVEDAK